MKQMMLEFGVQDVYTHKHGEGQYKSCYLILTASLHISGLHLYPGIQILDTLLDENRTIDLQREISANIQLLSLMSDKPAVTDLNLSEKQTRFARIEMIITTFVLTFICCAIILTVLIILFFRRKGNSFLNVQVCLFYHQLILTNID